jgi:predicted HTH transcriptional regulator
LLGAVDASERASEMLLRMGEFFSTILSLFLKNLVALHEQIILGTAYLEEEVTNSRMQSILELHSVDIGHILSELVSQGMLVPHRKGRWTTYAINTDYEIRPEQVRLEDIDAPALIFKNETDKIIYEYIRANKFITTHQIIEITRINTTQGASVALNRLMNMGLLKKVRKGKQVFYQLRN